MKGKNKLEIILKQSIISINYFLMFLFLIVKVFKEPITFKGVIVLLTLVILDRIFESMVLEKIVKNNILGYGIRVVLIYLLYHLATTRL